MATLREVLKENSFIGKTPFGYKNRLIPLDEVYLILNKYNILDKSM